MDIEKLKFLSFLGKIKVWSLIFNKMFDAYLKTYFFFLRIGLRSSN